VFLRGRQVEPFAHPLVQLGSRVWRDLGVGLNGSFSHSHLAH